jgi:hypothetical protein
MASIGTQIAEKLGLDPNEQLVDNVGIEDTLRSRQGKQPTIPVIDAGNIGQGQDLTRMNTQKNIRKTRKAQAAIQSASTPDISREEFDFASQLTQGLDPDTQNIVRQTLGGLDELTGGQFTKTQEDITKRMLDAQAETAKRARDQFSLMEEAELPELEAELFGIQDNFNIQEAARNSRLVNETGKVGGLTKSQINDRTSEIQRQYGLQTADNRINELVVAGKINAATNLIDSKLDLKYGDLETEINLYKSQLDAIAPFVDREQQKVLEQRQLLLSNAQATIDGARASEKELGLAKAQAIKNARDRGASQGEINTIMDASSMSSLAATGFTTSALEKAQLQGQYLANRATLLDLAAAGDPTSIAQLGYDPAGFASLDEARANEQEFETSVGNLQRVDEMLSDSIAIDQVAGAAKGFFARVFERTTRPGEGVTIPEATVRAEDFLAKASFIINDATFSELLSLKEAGATFGSLTEGERIAIGRASSDFAASAEVDEAGNVTGFRGSEEQLVKNISEIRKGYLEQQNILNAKMGLSNDEQLQIINIR